jgi:hypothetical protein
MEEGSRDRPAIRTKGPAGTIVTEAADPNSMDNAMDRIPLTHKRKQHRAVFVACRDSISQVEATARHGGIDTHGMLFLSRADDPSLRTLDDILRAIPESVQLILLDDAEHLLPAGERSPSAVRALLEGARIRYVHRGLTFVATRTDEELTGLTWEVWRRRP